MDGIFIPPDRPVKDKSHPQQGKSPKFTPKRVG
jgi:hypothetical protein